MVSFMKSLLIHYCLSIPLLLWQQVVHHVFTEIHQLNPLQVRSDYEASCLGME